MILRELTSEVGLKAVNNIQQSSVSTVPVSSQVTILTFTATTDHKITRISCSGESYAKYELYLDTSLIETKNVGKYSVDFKFDIPLLVQNGQIFDVKVTHFYTGKTFDYDATIYSII